MKRWTTVLALPATALVAGGLVLTGGAGAATASSGHHATPAAAHPAARSAAQARSQAGSSERAHPEGSVRPASHIRFDLLLRMRHAGAAQHLLREVSSPANSHYRHYVTAKAWEKRFSPTTASVRATEKWVRHHDFTVHAVSRDRLSVTVSATARRVEKTFGTSLRYYRVDGHRVRLATGKLEVPAALGAVAGAVGVNQHLSTPEDAAVPPPPAFITAGPCANYYGQKTTTTSPAFGQGFPTTVPDEVCGYVPGQFRGAYGVPSSATGKGTTIAILDAYGSSTQPADAKKYFAAHDPSNPITTSNYSQQLDQPFDLEDECGAPGWQTEQAIDIEAAHGMAPGAHILYVGAQDCADGLLTSLQNIIDNHLADVVSNSYGDIGELLDDESYEAAIDDELMLAGSTGISVMFSSGDDGDSFDLAGISEPTYPAASPYGTAVGGTTLAIGPKDSRIADYGWSTGRSFECASNGVGIVPGCTSATVNTWLPVSFDGASGGGTDYFNPQPYYQKGIVPDELAERNSPVTETDDNYRVIPDISMEADPATGLLIGLTEQFPDGSVKYGETRYGGTSLASPLFAGVVADADQVAGAPLGFLNPELYDLDRHHSAAIKDVLPPATPQGQARFDYLQTYFATGAGTIESYREITYEGTEEYCDGTGNCATRPNTLSTATGYDSLTGVGTIGSGFIGTLAR